MEKFDSMTVLALLYIRIISPPSAILYMLKNGIIRHDDLYSSAITVCIHGKQKEPSLTALFVIIVIKYLI